MVIIMLFAIIGAIVAVSTLTVGFTMFAAISEPKINTNNEKSVEGMAKIPVEAQKTVNTLYHFREKEKSISRENNMKR